MYSSHRNGRKENKLDTQNRGSSLVRIVKNVGPGPPGAEPPDLGHCL